jgi:hypothetical protein
LGRGWYSYGSARRQPRGIVSLCIIATSARQSITASHCRRSRRAVRIIRAMYRFYAVQYRKGGAQVLYCRVHGMTKEARVSAKNGRGGLCSQFFYAKGGEADFASDCSLFSNPWSSKVSIKICVVASSGGAIIADDTKALTLAGWKIVEGRRKGRSPPILHFARYLLI